MTISQRIELIRELRECLAEVKTHADAWQVPGIRDVINNPPDPVQRTVGILIRAIERNVEYVEKVEREARHPIAKVTFDDGSEKLVYSSTGK
jgi:hypothetical protein